jgi:hypothetical protein
MRYLTREKVYITAGPEFGTNLHGEIPVINKSLYGFHEHLSESLPRFGFK